MAIFMVACVALAAVALAQTIWRERFQPPAPLGALTWLRLALPFAAMLVTGILTQTALNRFVAETRAGNVRVTLEHAAPVFYRGKLAATLLFGLTGAFSAACLVAGHTVKDVLLALLPIVLLLITRPSEAGLAAFALLAHEKAGAAT